MEDIKKLIKDVIKFDTLDKGTRASGKRYEAVAKKYDEEDLKAFSNNRFNRYIAKLLGDEEGVRKSYVLSREIGKSLLDNDRTEDTLRHIFLGGNVKSPIGSFLIDKREWLEGKPRKPPEGQIPKENYVDENNNKYGRALREMYPNDEDFDREALKAAFALYQGKEPPEIEGLKPILSTGENYFNYNEMTQKPIGLKPNTNEMAKGGTVMNKQMQMAFMEDGGLQDDGMDRDPVSGNKVPSGSLAKEVRDDIPAQLSEGEYVVPADVVRFFGLKFFEDLRMQAKIGLQTMEKTGRIGGQPIEEPDMIEPDANISPEDEQLIIAMTGMNKGGVIKAAEGVDVAAGETDTMANVLKDYSFVGSSLFEPIPAAKGVVSTRNYYHPDGRVQAVRFDTNGNVLAEDAQFVQEPWSSTPPSQKATQEITQQSFDAFEGMSDAEKRKLQGLPEDPSTVKSSVDLANKFKEQGGQVVFDNFGQPVKMSTTNYSALITSYNRLKGIGGIETFRDYYYLPFNTKIKLAPYEIQSQFQGKESVNSDAVGKIVGDAKDGLPENIIKLMQGVGSYVGNLLRPEGYVSPEQKEGAKVKLSEFISGEDMAKPVTPTTYEDVAKLAKEDPKAYTAKVQEAQDKGVFDDQSKSTFTPDVGKPFKDTAPEITKKQDDAVKAYQEDKVKAYLSKGPGSQMFKGQGGRNTGGLVSKPKTKTKTKKILGKKT